VNIKYFLLPNFSNEKEEEEKLLLAAQAELEIKQRQTKKIGWNGSRTR